MVYLVQSFDVGLPIGLDLARGFDSLQAQHLVPLVGAMRAVAQAGDEDGADEQRANAELGEADHDTSSQIASPRRWASLIFVMRSAKASWLRAIDFGRRSWPTRMQPSVSAVVLPAWMRTPE